MPDHNAVEAHVRIRYVPGLDGLRGAAVLVVVAFHLGHLRGGYLGVDLFFVLSGFLITSLLLAEAQGSGRIGLARFWERRARRLLPALGVLLVGVAAYARFAARPEELHRIRWDGLATLLYLANWRAIVGKLDYWALFTAPSPLEHTWSLAIEEQFYLVWPLVFVGLLALVRRRSRRSGRREVRSGASDVSADRRSLANLVLALALGLGVLSLAEAAFFQHRDGWNRVYYGTDTRAFAILAGAAAAAHTARFGPVRDGRPRRALEVGGVLSVAVLGAAWVALDGASSLAHHGGLALCSVAGALVIATVAHPTRGTVSRVFSFVPLRWMGLISYGVYLYHWPLIVWLTPQRVHLSGWPLAAVQFATTIGVAIVSYKVVEQPIRRRTGWPLRMNVLVPVGGFSLVALLLVTATITSELPPSGPSYRTVAAAVKSAQIRKGPKVMVVGNSVASYLAADGMKRLDHDPQMTVLNMATAGCSEPPTEKFLKFNGQISRDFGFSCQIGWDWAVANFHPDVVIYARNGISEADFWHDGGWVAPCSKEFHDWSFDRMVSDADKFSKAGVAFVLVTSLPSMTAYSASRTAAYGRAVECGNQVLREVAAARSHEVRLVDLFSHYCSSSAACLTRLPDNQPLRPDGTHFRGEGALVSSQWILAKIGIDTSLPK